MKKMMLVGAMVFAGFIGGCASTQTCDSKADCDGKACDMKQCDPANCDKADCKAKMCPDCKDGKMCETCKAKMSAALPCENCKPGEPCCAKCAEKMAKMHAACPDCKDGKPCAKCAA